MQVSPRLIGVAMYRLSFPGFATFAHFLEFCPEPTGHSFNFVNSGVGLDCVGPLANDPDIPFDVSLFRKDSMAAFRWLSPKISDVAELATIGNNYILKLNVAGNSFARALALAFVHRAYSCVCPSLLSRLTMAMSFPFASISLLRQPQDLLLVSKWVPSICL